MKIFYLFISIILFSCHDQSQKRGILIADIPNKNGVIADTLLLDNIDSAEKRSLEKDSPYLGDPLSGTWIMEGHIYYLKLNGVIFRLRKKPKDSAVIDDSLIIEKKVARSWVVNIITDLSGRDIDTVDVNVDGYTDLVNEWKINDAVMLFSPEKQEFDTTVLSLPPSLVLLDSMQKIFYSSQPYDHSPTSVLFQFQGIYIYSYYMLKYRWSEDMEKTIEIKLYKFPKEKVNTLSYVKDNNDSAIYLRTFKSAREIEMVDGNSNDNDDDIPFWKANYKQLLKEYK